MRYIDKQHQRAFLAAIMMSLTLVSCGRNIPLSTGAPPDRRAFEQGVEAFHEATPEGYQRAAESFRNALALSPETCQYSVHLAQALTFLAFEQKYNWEEFEPRVSEARTILDSAQQAPACSGLQAVSDRVRALAMYVHDPTHSNEYMAAINRSIDASPSDALSWIVLWKLQPGDRREPILHALDLAPDLAIVQYEYGNSLLNRPDGLSQASAAFDRALERSPHHFQSLVAKVYALGSEEFSDQIEPLLRQAVELAPRYLRARMLLGDYYAGMEETEKAAEQYNMVIALNPRYYPAHLSLGTALLTAERLDDAETSFTNLLQLDVKTPQPPMNGVDLTADCQAHYYLGNIWLDRGDTEKAKAEYVAALADISNHMDSVYGLAFALYQEGNVDGALVEFNRVLAAAPQLYPTAYTARAGIRVIRRQFADALEDYTRAVEIYKQDLVMLDSRVKTDEAKGWTRKVEGDRRRKSQMESRLEKAMEAKKVLEARLGGGPHETR
jgi:tetratricopeptide (TPR) repeat protein